MSEKDQHNDLENESSNIEHVQNEEKEENNHNNQKGDERLINSEAKSMNEKTYN